MAKSAFLDFLNDLESIGSKRLEATPCRIAVYGENDYLRQLYARAMRELARRSSCDVTILECDKSSTSLADTFGQDDLFSEQLFYQINAKDQETNLYNLLQRSQKNQVKHHLFLQINSKKLPEKLKKELSKNNFQVAHAANPAPFEYTAFIQARCKTLGLGLGREAWAAILEHYGQDLIQIDNELRRLNLIFPDKKQIPMNELTPHLGFLREDESFRLRQYILDGKRSLALCLAADLQRRGESTLAVLGFMTKHIRQSCQIASGLKEGTPAQDLIRATHLHPSTFKRYTDYCRKVGLTRLRQGWRACVKADQLAKTGRLRDDLLFVEILNLIA